MVIVLGIDLGNDSSRIASLIKVNRPGQQSVGNTLTVIINESSERSNPCLITFKGKQRFIGDAAVNVRVSNAQNTISEFKMLIGKHLSDPDVIEFLKFSSSKLVENSEGELCSQVEYNNETTQIPVKTAVAFFLTKLKEVATFAIEGKKNPLASMDAVISVPSFFDQQQRTAVMEAAQIAGIHTYTVVSDIAAICMEYGFPKTDLPVDTPVHVVFVLIGNAYTTVAVCEFKKDNFSVIAHASTQEVSGRVIDRRIAQHFAKVIEDKYHLTNVLGSAKNKVRLLQAAVSVKKVLTGGQVGRYSVENISDIDFAQDYKRQDFEELIKDLLTPLNKVCEEAVKAAVDMLKIANPKGSNPLDLLTLHAVEILGGTSRIPLLKQTVEKFFNRPLSTTLNSEDCIAKGCMLIAVQLSPYHRGRSIQVSDALAYTTGIKWCKEGDELKAEKQKFLSVFKQFQRYSITQRDNEHSLNVTFKRTRAFTFSLLYENTALNQRYRDTPLSIISVPDVPQPPKDVWPYLDPAVVATLEKGGRVERQVRVRMTIKITGCTVFDGAFIEEEYEHEEKEKVYDKVVKEEEKKEEKASDTAPGADAGAGAGAATKAAETKPSDAGAAAPTDTTPAGATTAGDAAPAASENAGANTGGAEPSTSFSPSSSTTPGPSTTPTPIPTLSSTPVPAAASAPAPAPAPSSTPSETAPDTPSSSADAAAASASTAASGEGAASAGGEEQKKEGDASAGSATTTDAAAAGAAAAGAATGAAAATPTPTPAPAPAPAPVVTPAPHKPKYHYVMKKTKKQRRVTLASERRSPIVTPEAVMGKLIQFNVDAVDRDRVLRETTDAKNQLEQYIYTVREKVDSGGEMEEFIDPKEKEDLTQKLDDVENWMNEESVEDMQKSTIQEKYSSLYAIGNVVNIRFTESKLRPEKIPLIFSNAEVVIKEANKPEKAHIAEEERKKVIADVENCVTVLKEKMAEQEKKKKCENPVFICEEVVKEYQKRWKEWNKILSQKPPPPPPPPVPAPVAAPAPAAPAAGDAAAPASGDAAAPAAGDAAAPAVGDAAAPAAGDAAAPAAAGDAATGAPAAAGAAVSEEKKTGEAGVEAEGENNKKEKAGEAKDRVEHANSPIPSPGLGSDESGANTNTDANTNTRSSTGAGEQTGTSMDDFTIESPKMD